MDIADLHSHTTASDGTYTPAESVRRAKEKNLRAFAITDHDTVAGLKEAMTAGEHLGVEIVPGIEISTVAENQDIHILGYYINYEEPSFLKEIEALRTVRERRNEMIIENLKKLGVSITMEEVAKRKGMTQGNIGRPHIAEVLMEKGLVHSLQEAFQIYLGKGGKAYANVQRISPEEAIELIHRAGGVAVIAHPGLYDAPELVERLIAYGVDGIEVKHTDHSRDQIEMYSQLAKQYNLIATAGSDFHGERNGVIFHGDIATCTTDYKTVEKLKQKRARL